jgi:hypothetical protein
MLYTLRVNGIDIAILNTHNTPGTASEAAAVRQAQYGEIIDTILSSYSNAIVFGDLNSQSIDELDIFTEAGFTLLNGGVFEAIKTGMTNEIVPAKPFDNIIIKGNRIKGIAYAGDPVYIEGHADDTQYYVSDHLPLIVDLTII